MAIGAAPMGSPGGAGIGALFDRINRQKSGCVLMKKSVEWTGCPGRGRRPLGDAVGVGGGSSGERNGGFKLIRREGDRQKHCGPPNPKEWRARHSI